MEILALLGAGGMGAVYKARQPAGGIPARYHVAEFDAKTGSLIAKLLPRGTVSLLAISDSGAAANGVTVRYKIVERAHFE